VRGFIIKKVKKIADHPLRFALYNTPKRFGSENFRDELPFQPPGGIGKGFWIDKGRGDVL